MGFGLPEALTFSQEILGKILVCLSPSKDSSCPTSVPGNSGCLGWKAESFWGWAEEADSRYLWEPSFSLWGSR